MITKSRETMKIKLKLTKKQKKKVDDIILANKLIWKKLKYRREKNTYLDKAAGEVLIENLFEKKGTIYHESDMYSFRSTVGYFYDCWDQGKFVEDKNFKRKSNYYVTKLLNIDRNKLTIPIVRNISFSEQLEANIDSRNISSIKIYRSGNNYYGKIIL